MLLAVDHYNVYRSVLTPRGANYTILEKISLLPPPRGSDGFRPERL